VFGEATGDAPRTPSEPLAGAFAAELLAPQRELPRFDSRFWTHQSLANQALQDVCNQFDVGRELALRQLQNRRSWPETLIESLLAMPAA
jgi:Zn-dependent peptidase ImmA (M78 family)